MRIHTANERITNQAPYTIYALTEPGETDVLVVARIRYIGKAKNPDRRLREHLTSARRGSRRYCYNWIRQLVAAGFVPNLEVLCTVNAVDASKVEKETIARLHMLGAPLTNLTDGGEGTLGWEPSPETRANMSAAAMGNKNCLGNKNALGHRHSEEAKRKTSVGRTGKGLGNKNALGHRHSKEANLKKSARMMGNKNGLGNKNSLGYRHSAEAKLKMSAARQTYWVTKKRTNEIHQIVVF